MRCTIEVHLIFLCESPDGLFITPEKPVKYVTYSQPYVTLLSAKIFTFDHHHLMIENMSDTKEGNWNEQKRKLKLKFPDLTDRDLMYWDGKKDKMLEKLQVKLGKSRDELNAVLAGL